MGFYRRDNLRIRSSWKLCTPLSSVDICSWRAASISSIARNSSSVMSERVMVRPMDLAPMIRKHRRTSTPLGVFMASSSRFLGQAGPWLTSMAFQPAPHAGHPSNSACAEDLGVWNLAPQVGLEPTTLRLTAERLIAASHCKRKYLYA